MSSRLRTPFCCPLARQALTDCGLYVSHTGNSVPARLWRLRRSGGYSGWACATGQFCRTSSAMLVPFPFFTPSPLCFHPLDMIIMCVCLAEVWQKTWTMLMMMQRQKTLNVWLQGVVPSHHCHDTPSCHCHDTSSCHGLLCWKKRQKTWTSDPNLPILVLFIVSCSSVYMFTSTS